MLTSKHLNPEVVLTFPQHSLCTPRRQTDVTASSSNITRQSQVGLSLVFRPFHSISTVNILEVLFRLENSASPHQWICKKNKHTKNVIRDLQIAATPGTDIYLKNSQPNTRTHAQPISKYAKPVSATYFKGLFGNSNHSLSINWSERI